MGVFDDSQLVMHHGPVPAFPVGRQMPNHPVEQGAAQALVLVDSAQFCPFLFRLMLNFIALGGDALVQNLPGGPCRKIASKGHRDPSGHHFTQHDQEKPCGRNLTDGHDEHQGGDQAIIESKDNLAQPITPMWVLFIYLLQRNQFSFSSRHVLIL